MAERPDPNPNPNERPRRDDNIERGNRQNERQGNRLDQSEGGGQRGRRGKRRGDQDGEQKGRQDDRARKQDAEQPATPRDLPPDPFAYMGYEEVAGPTPVRVEPPRIAVPERSQPHDLPPDPFAQPEGLYRQETAVTSPAFDPFRGNETDTGQPIAPPIVPPSPPPPDEQGGWIEGEVPLPVEAPPEEYDPFSDPDAISFMQGRVTPEPTPQPAAPSGVIPPRPERPAAPLSPEERQRQKEADDRRMERAKRAQERDGAEREGKQAARLAGGVLNPADGSWTFPRLNLDLLFDEHDKRQYIAPDQIHFLREPLRAKPDQRWELAGDAEGPVSITEMATGKITRPLRPADIQMQLARADSGEVLSSTTLAGFMGRARPEGPLVPVAPAAPVQPPGPAALELNLPPDQIEVRELNLDYVVMDRATSEIIINHPEIWGQPIQPSRDKIYLVRGQRRFISHIVMPRQQPRNARDVWLLLRDPDDETKKAQATNLASFLRNAELEAQPTPTAPAPPAAPTIPLPPAPPPPSDRSGRNILEGSDFPERPPEAPREEAILFLPSLNLDTAGIEKTSRRLRIELGRPERHDFLVPLTPGKTHTWRYGGQTYFLKRIETLAELHERDSAGAITLDSKGGPQFEIRSRRDTDFDIVLENVANPSDEQTLNLPIFISQARRDDEPGAGGGGSVSTVSGGPTIPPQPPAPSPQPVQPASQLSAEDLTGLRDDEAPPVPAEAPEEEENPWADPEFWKSLPTTPPAEAQSVAPSVFSASAPEVTKPAVSIPVNSEPAESESPEPKEIPDLTNVSFEPRPMAVHTAETTSQPASPAEAAEIAQTAEPPEATTTPEAPLVPTSEPLPQPDLQPAPIVVPPVPETAPAEPKPAEVDSTEPELSSLERLKAWIDDVITEANKPEWQNAPVTADMFKELGGDNALQVMAMLAKNSLDQLATTSIANNLRHFETFAKDLDHGRKNLDNITGVTRNPFLIWRLATDLAAGALPPFWTGATLALALGALLEELNKQPQEASA